MLTDEELLEEALNLFEIAKAKLVKEEKIFRVPNDITEKDVLSSIVVTNVDIVTLNIISKHKDLTQWREKITKIVEKIIESKIDAGYKIEVSTFSIQSYDNIRNEAITKVKTILLRMFDEMDKDKKPMQSLGDKSKKERVKELENLPRMLDKIDKPISTRTKNKEEQVKELEDSLIKLHTKPNETWVYVPAVEVAKLVRQVLKIYFPNQKFSVRKTSGGGSIDVNWNNGPTEREVEKIISKYHSTEFDAMHDSTISLNKPWGNNYIFLHRFEV